MARLAVRRLQRLLTEPRQHHHHQNQRQRSPPRPVKRERNVSATHSNSITATTSSSEGYLVRCCFRSSRNPSLYILVVFFAAVAFSYHKMSMYRDVMEDDDITLAEAVASSVSAEITEGGFGAMQLRPVAIDTPLRDHELSIKQISLDHLQTLSKFPKIVHLVWPDRDVLSKDFRILQYGAKYLRRLNPDWKFIVHDYDDVDDMIELFSHPDIPPLSIAALKHAHITEKVDAFRLMIIYETGGLFVGIDRVMNVHLDQIMDVDKVKLVVPTHYNINFSSDLFGSSPKNRLILNALRRQSIDRVRYPRRNGWVKHMDQINLSRTYTSSMEEDLFGKSLGSGNPLWGDARSVLTLYSKGTVVTHRNVWCNGFLVNDFDGCKDISSDLLYQAYDIPDWTRQVNRVWRKEE